MFFFGQSNGTGSTRFFLTNRVELVQPQLDFIFLNRDQPAHLDFEMVEVAKIARFASAKHPNNTIFWRESS